MAEDRAVLHEAAGQEDLLSRADVLGREDERAVVALLSSFAGFAVVFMVTALPHL